MTRPGHRDRFRIVSTALLTTGAIALGAAAVLWSPARSERPIPAVAGPVEPIPPAPVGFSFSIPTPSGSGCEFWVAPTGDDSGAGSEDDPFRTLEHAAATVPDDRCVVWFEPGTYVGYNQVKRRFTTLTTFRSADPYRAVLEGTGIVVDIDGARNVIIDGFEIRHRDSSGTGYPVIVDQGDGLWAENIVIRNNVIHDSYDNDLLKIHNGVRNAVVEGNVFYNQGESEQHLDINSVTDVVIQDNIFFNDYLSSDRSPIDASKHFIVVKDSNEGDDGLLGARRITIRRNVMLNWEGGRESIVKIGNDGKPYHEADTVTVVNNLVVGNSGVAANSAFGVAGVRHILFANNTVTGDLPANQYAISVQRKGQNPLNENIWLANNIWSDPTGTMDSFARGDAGDTSGLDLVNNLYWNGGGAVPDGEPVGPADDPVPVLGDPLLRTDHRDVVVPRWTGTAFVSGNQTIREEFLRLIATYGRPGSASAVVDRSDPAFTPPDDILGNTRGPTADLGAFEVDPAVSRVACPESGTVFVDVVSDRYFSDPVRWLACEGITTGTSPTTFSPDDPVTRAQMATILWRFAGRPDAPSLSSFVDVSPGPYFTEPVGWLDEVQVTAGTSPTTFSPDDLVTRAQMATFLWRLAGQPTV